MRDQDDAVAKVKLMKGFSDYLSPCGYRCITGDALHAVWAITDAVDKKYHTDYHQNAVNLVKNVQKNDWILEAAATDPKGDRSKGPNEQADPDLYLHVVEKKKESIVVRVARPHGTATAYLNMLLVFGTVPPNESAKDYSFAFFTPVDTEGITFVCRPPSIPSEPKELENPLSSRFGHVETLTIYDNVLYTLGAGPHVW
jgi:4-hydroxybutyryl-CoA dehydratase/vinylacetyl-CoA-Delta-isomerase